MMGQQCAIFQGCSRCTRNASSACREGVVGPITADADRHFKPRRLFSSRIGRLSALLRRTLKNVIRRCCERGAMENGQRNSSLLTYTTVFIPKSKANAR
jgi:hypothetical protein